MAVPKATETRYRDGSVQARQVIKSIHKQPHPFFFLYFKFFCEYSYEITENISVQLKKM